MADLNLSKQYLYNGVRYGPGPMSSDDEELVGALVARETNGEAENAQRQALIEQYGPAGVGHDYVQNFGSLAPVETDQSGAAASDDGTGDDDDDEEPGMEFDTNPSSPTFGTRIPSPGASQS